MDSLFETSLGPASQYLFLSSTTSPFPRSFTRSHRPAPPPSRRCFCNNTAQLRPLHRFFFCVPSTAFLQVSSSLFFVFLREPRNPPSCLRHRCDRPLTRAFALRPPFS
mmetsp:Transcript_18423/g.56547  ORF Transcript_18423/g.56547 Transcript_18423/m.56547 type:complete len:108 (+) Transcript_18423:224-547(+)